MSIPARIYVAYASGQIGLWMLRAVVLYDAFSSQDQRALALVVFAIFFPLLISSQFLAPTSARFPARRTMAVVEGFRVAVVLVLASSGTDSREWLAPVVVCFLGLAQPIFASAQVAYLRAALDDARLASALGALANVERATHIAGLVAGSLLLATLSVSQTLGLSIIALAASAMLIALLPLAPSGSSAPGVDSTTESAGLGPLLASVLALNMGAGVINLYQIIASVELYDAGPEGLAFMFFTVGCLGLAGAAAAGPAAARLGRGRAALYGAAGVAASLLAMAAPLGLAWSAVAGGAMLGFGQVFAVAAHAEIVSRHSSGGTARGSARFQAMTFGGIACNALLFWALAPHLSFTTFVLACAMTTALCLPALFRIASEANAPRAHLVRPTRPFWSRKPVS